MAVRARDAVTLATLPALTYSRMYYLLQDSMLSPPAIPTSNPPATPWSGTEPAYSAGSTSTLYTCIVNVYGSVAHEWGQVQVSSSYEAAKQAYNLAFSATQTVDGMRRVVPSITEPTPPAAGWMNGDQWWQYEVEPVTGRNRIANIWVWNGTAFVPFQIVADSLLIPGSVGNILLADGAIDAMTITGAQIYGGYIEAPVIASSDKLGTGANVLNDPEFTSTLDTAWVASGHLGDAAKTQTDTVTWDQTPVVSGTSYRRQGAVNASMTFPTITREVGSLLFANYSWVPSNRTLTNPHTYATSFVPGAGASDPTFAAVAAPPLNTKVTRTTYLTNSVTQTVAVGDIWTADLELDDYSLGAAVRAAMLENVEIAVEVVNASTSAVLWSHVATTDELSALRMRATWVSTFAGNVKVRIRATYLAAGGTGFNALAFGPLRKLGAGSYEKAWTGATQVRNWPTDAPSQPFPGSADPTKYSWLYGGSPSESAFARGSGNASIDTLSAIRLRAKRAVFAKVEPEKGWRLTEGGGLELFNEAGAKTGQLDGETNFISGEIATAESGLRWELVGDQINLYSAANVLLGSIRRDGTKIRVDGTLSLNGFTVPTETAYAAASFTPTSGHTVAAKSWARKRSDGYVYGAIYIDRTTDFVNGAVLCNLPAALWPVAAEEDSVAIVSKGGGAGFHVGQALSTGGLRMWSGPVVWTNNRLAYIPLSYFAAP